MASDISKELFLHDTYDTPANTSRSFIDRLFLNSRWGLYLQFAGIVIKGSGLARKGKMGDDNWFKYCLKVIRRIEACCGRFHITGMDNLRKTDEPVVIVGNHMSTLETVVLPGVILPSRPLSFVVKESLLKGPIFGPIMRAVEPVPVGRKNPKDDLRAVMEGGKQVLESGKSLVIFPQSTRVQNFDPEKFNSLGVKLARKAGVQVMPLALKTDYWGDSKLIKGFGPVHRDRPIHISFGEPMTVSGTGKEEHRKIVEFIAFKMDGWTNTGKQNNSHNS